jgi:hypothetical protein
VWPSAPNGATPGTDWRPISAPYLYDWDLCGSGVPDGDIELGLEAWDNAGNHYVYSEHFTNYHITKSYNCGSPSPTNTVAATASPTVTPTTTDSDLEPGFPVKAINTGGTYQGGPVIHTLVGNIDSDLNLEIVVTGLATGPLYAWNSDGSPVTGWRSLLQCDYRHWATCRTPSWIRDFRRSRAFPAG